MTASEVRPEQFSVAARRAGQEASVGVVRGGKRAAVELLPVWVLIRGKRIPDNLGCGTRHGSCVARKLLYFRLRGAQQGALRR